MSIKLKGATSGSVSLDVPAAVSGGDISLTLPDVVGSAGQVLKNGSIAGQLEYGLTLPSGNGSPNQVLKNGSIAGQLEYGLTLPSGNGSAGQYLRNSGTAGTLEFGDIPASGAEWTSGTSTSLSGSSSTTFSSLPASIKQITITLSAASPANFSVTPISFRLGSGGSDKTSGYVGRSVHLTAGSNPTVYSASTAFVLDAWTNASNSVDGRVTFTNHTGNEWVCSGIFSTGQDDSHHLVTGRVTLSGSLDQITIRNSGVNFDAGTANVHYLTT